MVRFVPFVLTLAVISTLLLAQPAGSLAAEDGAITVAGWNVGLDDAEVETIAARIAEVNRTNAASNLEAAAEAGETGEFAAVVGRSGDAMRLVALYDDTPF